MIERQNISLDIMTVDVDGDHRGKVTDLMFVFVSYMKKERPSLRKETNVLERYNQKWTFWVHACLDNTLMDYTRLDYL